jgi:hypothetical protein
LAEYVLRPTLHHLSASQQKLDLLLSIIKEKDHVIEKLLDRVADKGTDMSMIFPKLTGMSKRGAAGVKVEDARKLVPGMQRFSREEWERDIESSRDGNEGSETAGDKSLLLGLEELVKGCEKCFSHTKEEHEGWTAKLADGESLGKSQPRSFLNKSQSQSQNPSQPRDDEDTDSENEFERQATPPQLRKRRGRDSAEHESSSAEDAEGGGRQPAKKKPRIGVLRKERLGSSPMRSRGDTPAHSSHNEISKNPQATASDTSTASESESEADSRLSKAEKSKVKPSRLGGLKRTTNTSSSQSQKLQEKPPERPSSPSPRPTTADSNVSNQSRRLGRIGRLKGSTQSPSHEATRRGSNSDGGSGKSKKEIDQDKPATIELRNKKQQTGTSTESQTTRAQERDFADVSDDDKPQVPSKKLQAVDSDATASPTPSPSPSPSIAPPPSRPAEATSKDRGMSPPPDPSLKDDRSIEMQNWSAKSEDASQSQKNMAEQEAKRPETEEEKVNRRREELKRTIQTRNSETKSTGPGLGGMKKKRRF